MGEFKSADEAISFEKESRNGEEIENSLLRKLIQSGSICMKSCKSKKRTILSRIKFLRSQANEKKLFRDDALFAYKLPINP